MIKRANNKKKKGFTLIELIIVLAVMAIIALIAIPNFTAVRENSKVKADAQSCEMIERTILMLAADETIKGTGSITFTPKTALVAANVTGITTDLTKIDEALAKVEVPQSKTKKQASGTDAATEVKGTKYQITIGANEVVTVTPIQ